MQLISHYDYNGKKRIEVGITDFSKAGKPVEKYLNLSGNTFIRISTGVIPNSLMNSVCSVQIYELENESDGAKYPTPKPKLTPLQKSIAKLQRYDVFAWSNLAIGREKSEIGEYVLYEDLEGCFNKPDNI